MAHDPSLAYADYFAAAGGVATLVPEVDAAGEDDGHLYGGAHAHHHHHGLDVFGGARGGLVPASAHHGKGAAAALGDFGLGGAEHHRLLLGHGQQAPLTSLSLHGSAEAASLALHHHQLGGGALRQHQPAAWPPPQQQQQGGAAWHLRGSRFLRPTQQLLQEFCGLPVEAASAAASKPPTKPGSEDGAGEGSSSSSAPSTQIQAMDAAELQRLKAKLYAMLQEVALSNRSSLTHHASRISINRHAQLAQVHQQQDQLASQDQEPLHVLGNLKSCCQVRVQLWLLV